MKKFILYTLGIFWLTTVAIGGYGFYEASVFLRTSPMPINEAEEIIITIPTGSGLNKVSEILYENKIITNPLYFKILAKYLESDKNIKAGRFAFNTSWLPQQVLDHLIMGKTVYTKLTIREGLTWWELGRLLEEEGYTTFNDFKKIIHDKDFLAHWGIPFHNAEGFLYPDTYYLPAPQELNEKAAKAIAGRLIDTFWRKTDNLWRELEQIKAQHDKNIRITPADKRIFPKKADLNKYLTLASIIEKETGIAHERAKVSGVYANRLKTNMRLQADPTVAYGEGENFIPPLLHKHLNNTSNTYNTYRINGLPPGPIASPSLSSIQAALYPEKHNFYYFVAKGTDGSHYFSKSLSEHNRNVQKYRQTLKNN